MAKIRLRRLFEIKPQHVSLVDRAANKRVFLIEKREGGVSMDELKPVLEKIESVLNEMSGKIEPKKSTFEESIIDILEYEELEKAGAKFSKATMAQLKSLRDSITKLLGDGTEKKDDEEEKDKDIKKSEVDVGDLIKSVFDKKEK